MITAERAWKRPSVKIVAPSILSADFANLERDILRVANAGADWIHVDVMDGHFVPNLTIGAPVVRSIKKVCPLPLDVHLMIERPERYIDDFLEAGSDILTIHQESTEQVSICLKRIRDKGAKAGLTLRPRTDLSQVMGYLDEVDLILIMTVEPGFGGQKFMMDQVSKISRLRSEIDRRGLNVLIEVDGGINESTLCHCSDADALVAGNFIFGGKVEESIAFLKDNKACSPK